jgi:hypothetical protein
VRTTRNRRLTIAGKAAVAAFCLWHMFAVAVASVPFSDTGAAPSWIRERLAPPAFAYLWMTNQWQRWHLFVPEMPGYDTRFVLEAVGPGIRLPASFLTEEEANALRGEDAGAKRAIASVHCRRLSLPSGMPVRLTQRDYVLLPEGALDAPGAAMDGSFEWFQYHPLLLLCP